MRRKIDHAISRGTPKHIAIAKGWTEFKKTKPVEKQPTINTSSDKDLINNKYYRAKNGLPLED